MCVMVRAACPHSSPINPFFSPPHNSDFGMSRFKDSTVTMTAVGTPLYIAPEIWARERYDESVDMYASASLAP